MATLTIPDDKLTGAELEQVQVALLWRVHEAKQIIQENADTCITVYWRAALTDSQSALSKLNGGVMSERAA